MPFLIINPCVHFGHCHNAIATHCPLQIEQLLYERRARAYATLDRFLSTRTFFVGERITLADVHIASLLVNPLRVNFDAEARAKYPHLTRHFETIYNQPKIKPIFGDIQYVEKAQQYVPPPKPKKEEKPKEAPKPKAEKPKEAPKPKKEAEPEDDEEDDLVKEEPKPKNPLDSLPKSSFNLEDFKRAYSNMDTRGDGGSLKWFYEK
jgi:elongation factor 1-gamma